MNKEKIAQILIEKGKEFMNSPKKLQEFTGEKEVDKLLNDLEKYPHAFVLACIMDRQIPAERAWKIPYLFSQSVEGFEFETLSSLTQEEIEKIFIDNNFHRFNKKMAINFYLAIQKIKENYGGDASNIWKDNPKSATIVRRFLEFRGSGIKISTMSANILARGFKIPMRDYLCIDISPDIQVRRVFERIGFISKKASNDELIYCARELNPEYPGVFDISCWKIGRKWCRPQNPKCKECYLNELCEKV